LTNQGISGDSAAYKVLHCLHVNSSFVLKTNRSLLKMQMHWHPIAQGVLKLMMALLLAAAAAGDAFSLNQYL